MSANDVLLYILSFVAIWFGSGLIISAIDGFSRKFHVSSFSLSFFVLGLLSTIPEFAVGITAIGARDPQIFVGNLLGGIPVLFLFAIPLLAVFGNGITLSHTLSRHALALTLFIIAIPSVFALDQRITILEAVTLLFLYGLLFVFIEHKRPAAHHTKSKKLLMRKSYSLMDMLHLLGGVIIVFISSKFIVGKTLAFSTSLHISSFLISLIVLSLGTNLPEMTLALRSLTSGKKDIALGDYVGSAAANVLFLGILTLVNGGEVIRTAPSTIIFLFIVVGLGLFYLFTRSKKGISRAEGLLLLGIYCIFVAVEVLKR